RIWLWAVRRRTGMTGWVVGEGVACLGLVGLAVGLAAVTPAFLVYVAVMVAGQRGGGVGGPGGVRRLRLCQAGLAQRRGVRGTPALRQGAGQLHGPGGAELPLAGRAGGHQPRPPLLQPRPLATA